MEYIRITKSDYAQLLKYRDIVNHIEEEVHEELDVRPLRDKRAIKVLKQREREIKEGKRKVVSDAEFSAKYRHLL